jgi:hypothetical protein
VRTITGSVRVTHPFHPLRGREISAVRRVVHWGEDRVEFLDEGGGLRSISASLTDIDPIEEFRRIAGGGAAFRPSDLSALADVLDQISERLSAKDA